MAKYDPDELDIQPADKSSGLAWGVEVEADDPSCKSSFYSARKVVLDGECVQIQLLDGSYMSHPIGRVRKVLAMRADSLTRYTDEDFSEDELY